MPHTIRYLHLKEALRSQVETAQRLAPNSELAFKITDNSRPAGIFVEIGKDNPLTFSSLCFRGYSTRIEGVRRIRPLRRNAIETLKYLGVTEKRVIRWHERTFKTRKR